MLKIQYLNLCFATILSGTVVLWSTTSASVSAQSLGADGGACNCDGGLVRNCRDLPLQTGGQACGGSSNTPYQYVHEVDDVEKTDSGNSDCDDPDCGYTVPDYEWDFDC